MPRELPIKMKDKLKSFSNDSNARWVALNKVVTIFCSFSNQVMASLSPDLESRFGHVACSD